MKKILTILLTLICLAVYGQQSNFTNTKFINGVASSSGANFPTSGLSAGMLHYKTTAPIGMHYYTGSAWIIIGSGAGTVTSVSVTTANGISGSVATATTTPAITLTLGAITPTTVNGSTISANSFSFGGGRAVASTTANVNYLYAGTAGLRFTDNTGTFTLGAITNAGVYSITDLAAGTAGTDSLIGHKDSDNTLVRLPPATNGTVTSVAALTLGTTGSDLSSSVANGTTTPVITLNVPTASASNRGALSSTDWSTFNGKAPTASPTFTGDMTLTNGSIISTHTGDLFYSVAATTTNKSVRMTNTGGSLSLMVNRSTGGIWSGDTPYSSILATEGNTVLEFGTNSTIRYSISGAGAHDFKSGTATFGNTVILGTNDITMTGSLAATGARATKGWFTNLEITNSPTVNGTAISAIYAPIASPTFTGTVTLPASTSFVTPALGAATATSIVASGALFANSSTSYFTNSGASTVTNPLVLYNNTNTVGAGSILGFSHSVAQNATFSNLVTNVAGGVSSSFNWSLMTLGTLANKMTLNNSGNLTLTGTTITMGAVVMTAPAASGTLVTLAGAEALSGKTYAGSTATLTGLVTGLYFKATGGIASAVANTTQIGYSSGSTIVSTGPDASTNGNYTFSTIRSDGSNQLNPLTISGAGVVAVTNLATAGLVLNSSAGVLTSANTVSSAASVLSTHKLQVDIGGTTYYLLMTTVP